MISAAVHFLSSCAEFKRINYLIIWVTFSVLSEADFNVVGFPFQYAHNCVRGPISYAIVLHMHAYVLA